MTTPLTKTLYANKNSTTREGIRDYTPGDPHQGQLLAAATSLAQVCEKPMKKLSFLIIRPWAQRPQHSEKPMKTRPLEISRPRPKFTQVYEKPMKKQSLPARIPISRLALSGNIPISLLALSGRWEYCHHPPGPEREMGILPSPARPWKGHGNIAISRLALARPPLSPKIYAPSIREGQLWSLSPL